MIELTHINKRFKSKVVLDDINLKIADGKITAIVGPNGAGKSTIIGLISGYFRPTSGDIDHGTVSVMPDADNLYAEMTGKAFLKYMCKIKKADYKDAVHIADVLEISNDLNKKISTYSFGMKKKISFVQAYVGDFDTYIFDEPTSGVDVPSAKVMLGLVMQLAKQGKGVLLTSHNMTELETNSDYLYILRNGKIDQSGTMQDLEADSLAQNHYVFTTDDAANLVTFLTQVPQVEIVSKTDGQVVIALSDELPISDLIMKILEQHLSLTGFWQDHQHLADIAFSDK